MKIYEGWRLWRFREKLKDEKSLCLRMKEEEENILVNGGLGVAYGRPTAGTCRANFLKKVGFWLGKVWHGRAIADTGRAKILVLGSSIFFVFLLIFGHLPAK